MADKTFIGNVAAVADAWTYTVVDASSGKTHGLTAGSGKSVTVTLGTGEDTSSAATKVLAALQASTAGEFQEYTWSVAAAVVTGLAQIAGVPGTFTNASTSGTAGTLSHATPAKGPNFVDDGKNWTGGTLPATGDRIVFDENSPDALYGLTFLRDGSIVPAKVETRGFEGVIGLPAVRGAANSFGGGQGTPYPEYRNRFLQLASGTTEVNVGLDDADAVPQRVQLDLAGTGITLNVYGAAAPQSGEVASVYVQGTTGHPRLAVSQGIVGVALGTGAGGGFLDVLIGDEGNASQDADVLFGAGATVPLVHNQSGRSASAATVTALVMGISTTSHVQTDGDCTATADGGTIDFRSDGTLTVTAAGQGTTVDFSRSPVPKGLGASSTFKAGAKLIDPASTRTSGSGATFDHVSLPLSKLGPSVPVVKP